MTLPAAALTGGAAINVGSNLLTDSIKDEKSVYERLCSIDDTLHAIDAYNQRERERSPYIAEMTATYAAGAPAAGTQAFTPPSPLNVDHIIVALRATAATELAIAINIGTRTIFLPVGASDNTVVNTGVQRYDLPYHITSQVTFGTFGAFTGTAFVYIVGWLEQNRLGPQRVIGGDY